MAAATKETPREQAFSKHASLVEFSDYDLLHLVEDHEGDSTSDFAAVLEVERRSMGSRLSWMKRQGLLMRDSKGGWTLALRGKRLLADRGQEIEDIRKIATMIRKDRMLAWVGRRELRRNLR